MEGSVIGDWRDTGDAPSDEGDWHDVTIGAAHIDGPGNAWYPALILGQGNAHRSA